jgi:thymidylate synthase
MPQDKNGNFVLNLHSYWRSRDAFKAAFMNMFVISELHRFLAEKISEILGKEVKVGQEVDVSDSYHIYGKDFQEFQKFLKMCQSKKFEDRVLTTTFAKPFFEKAQRELESKSQ